MSYALTPQTTEALIAGAATLHPDVTRIEVHVGRDHADEAAVFFKVHMHRRFAAAATARVGAVLSRIAVALQQRAAPLGLPSYVEFTGGTAQV